MPRSRWGRAAPCLLVALTLAVGLASAAHTQTAPNPTVLVATGDISPDPAYPNLGGQDDLATSALVEQLNPARVATLGDNQYEFGKLASFTSPEGYAKSWGRPSILDRTCPAAGNHEYWNNAGAAGFQTYFAARLRACAAAGRPELGWYAYDLAGWRWYVLNSDCARTKPYSSPPCGQTSEQVKWLQADLAAHKQRCIGAMWHHPRWGSYFADDTLVQYFWRTLNGAHADLVLNGHEHSYARFNALTVDGHLAPNQAGIRQIVVGTGGRSLLPFTKPPREGLAVRDDTHWGVLKVSLRPDGYTTSFRATDGTSMDAHAAGCWA